MIETLRRAASSWIAKLMLGLLVLSFAAFGVGDMLSTVGGSTAARVGDRDIRIQEFAQEFELQVRQRRGGDQQAAIAMQFDRQVLGGMIAQAALAEEAELIGVDASDDAVIEQLRQLPAAQANGQFSQQNYQRFLRQIRMSKKDFEARMRQDLAGGLLMGALGGGGAVSQDAAKALWMWRNATRDLDLVRLDLDDAPAVDEPDEATLRAFYEAEIALFSNPEYREIAFAWIRAGDLADVESVTEQEARERYEAQVSRFQKPERRNLEQISFSDEDAAKAAAQRIEDGDRFSTVSSDAGFGANGVALGYVSRSDIESSDPMLAAAAFGEQQDGVIGPIKSSGGWMLVNIAGVSPAETTRFEEAQEELRREIARERAALDLPAIANALEDQRAGGLSLVDAAKGEGVTAGVVTIDDKGVQEDGVAAVDLPRAPDLLDRAFSMNAGEFMELTPTFGGEFYAIEVLSVSPAAPKPFDEVAEDVASAWTEQAKRDKLAEYAEGLRARAEAGEKLADIASEKGLDVERILGLSRAVAPPEAPSELVRQTLSEKPEDAIGKAYVAALEDGGGQAIGQITSTADAVVEEGSDEIEQIALRRGGGVSQDLLELYLNEAQISHGVEINQRAIDYVLRRQSGNDGDNGGM